MNTKINISGKIFMEIILATMIFSILFAPVTNAIDFPKADFDVDAQSAILMDAATGTVLYEKNADEPLPPASVTKVMTLLLIMEAVDSGTLKLDDMISTSENAASMGGSQIFLKVGEEMTAEDMIKSVIIASANDAAVALAEHIAGSEEAFVEKMNARAAELGLKNTHFENTNGLDDTTTNHKTSARDIAIMSRELIKHKKILEYSSIWMDTVRDGAFGLTNTNRLIRFYKGATGLKTGSTSRAKFCISATAERDGMHLIAVIMASPTRDVRNECAKKLLDYGFANYTVYRCESADMGEINVTGGIENICPVKSSPFELLIPKSKEKAITSETNLNPSAAAPLKEGDKLGEITYMLDGEIIGKSDITAAVSVDKISYMGVVSKIFNALVLK